MAITPIVYDTDYLYTLRSIDKINEVITSINEGLPAYNVEGDFISIVQQNATGTDVPTLVSYGATMNSTNDHISYDDTTKEFTALTTGYYAFKSRIRVGRTGSAGVAQIFLWAELSVDGGTIWNVTGNPVHFPLENTTDSKIFFDFSTVLLPAGAKLRTLFARSSTGNNSGGLMPSTPSTTLVTYGLSDTPSAQITIYRGFE